MLYALLYRIDHAGKKAAIVVPDADGLTIKACALSSASARVQVKAAEHFNQVKAWREKKDRRTPAAKIETLSGLQGWSVTSVDINTQAEAATSEDILQPTSSQWRVGWAMYESQYTRSRCPSSAPTRSHIADWGASVRLTNGGFPPFHAGSFSVQLGRQAAVFQRIASRPRGLT